MFSRRIPLKQLAVVCRSLATSLQAGVPILKAFDSAGRKSSDPRLRGAMADIRTRLESGEEVASALRAQGGAFPPLMVDMVHVAEHSGALPEVLRSLAEHYENNLRLRKDFISQITLPVLQLVAAILIIALLLFVLGIIASVQGGEPLDVLGWGLTGASGAITWLTGWAMAIVGSFVAYKLATNSLSGKAAVHRFVLRLPVIGTCMQSFAIARFSWAYHLTQEAGLPVKESLDASLRATANGAFIAAAPAMIGDVMEGHDLTEAMARTGLFPDDYLQIVDTGETTGTVPEQLARMSEHFEDQARRSLRALASALGWLVWAGVAAFIIFVIFSFIFWYIGMINEHMPQM
jgi:type IV pilus assembly protein PilC